jgi:hypothetical protein
MRKEVIKNYQWVSGYSIAKLCIRTSQFATVLSGAARWDLDQQHVLYEYICEVLA